MKKSKYTRSTRECSFGELRPEFIAGIRGFIESNKLGDIEGTIRHCYQTSSEKKGLFGKILHQFTDMVITPEWLFWGLSGDKVKASQGCAKLKDIAEIIDYEKSPISQHYEDHGVEIIGFLYRSISSSHRVTWFIALGKDMAGEKFRQELRDAVARAGK